MARTALAIMADAPASGPDLEVLYRAYRKRKSGGLLTSEERRALTAQQKVYAGRRSVVYFESEQQMRGWRARAKAAGYQSFSKWIVHQLQVAERGVAVDPIEHGHLEERVRHLQKLVDYIGKHEKDLERENVELICHVRRLTVEIADMNRWVRQKIENQLRPL